MRFVLGLLLLATLGGAWYTALDEPAQVTPVYYHDDGVPMPSPKPPVR